MAKITPFLMFQGNAEEALTFYMNVISDSEILHMERYGPDEMGKEEGTLKSATVSFKGQEFMFFESPTKHEFDFTPSFSIFITCDTEEEIDAYYQALSQDGQALMPLGDYGFSKKFGWVNDRFGVSWQMDWK
ncbi:VOC family protein [Falsibacillus pallidus]|uniref:VOC family protein n=1 Tax=Falsibacillus pallidus TaxID=493781 RepID=UPI003D982D3B